MTTQIFSTDYGIDFASAAADPDQYLTVEEVAARLGLPADLVLRRVEAGDVPARRVERLDGTPTYVLRLSDLGIEPPIALGDDTVQGVVELVGTMSVARSEFSAVTEAGETQAASAPADEMDVEVMVPPPVRNTDRPRSLDLIAADGPLSDIAGMSIDPRELVAGLLDRWERTLEQRIYAEQRQRFEAELVSRQSMVKELQMELRTARAEHAAAQTEKEMLLAERNRALADIERELDVARRAASQAQIQLQAQQSQRQTRKRGWFFGR